MHILTNRQCMEAKIELIAKTKLACVSTLYSSKCTYIFIIIN